MDTGRREETLETRDYRPSNASSTLTKQRCGGPANAPYHLYHCQVYASYPSTQEPITDSWPSQPRITTTHKTLNYTSRINALYKHLKHTHIMDAAAFAQMAVDTGGVCVRVFV